MRVRVTCAPSLPRACRVEARVVASPYGSYPPHPAHPRRDLRPVPLRTHAPAEAVQGTVRRGTPPPPPRDAVGLCTQPVPRGVSCLDSHGGTVERAAHSAGEARLCVAVHGCQRPGLQLVSGSFLWPRRLEREYTSSSRECSEGKLPCSVSCEPQRPDSRVPRRGGGRSPRPRLSASPQFWHIFSRTTLPVPLCAAASVWTRS